jgi:hypothetical protein
MAKKAEAEKYKTGNMSNKDKQFIKINCNRLTPEQIQNRLSSRRSLDAVCKEIDKARESLNGKAPSSPPLSAKRVAVSVAERLKMRPEWRKWEKQFSEEELEQFAAKYVELMGQFQEITSTEDMQIISLITNEILHDRVLVAKRDIVHDMAIARQLLDDALIERRNLEKDKVKKADKIVELNDFIDKLHVDIETYKAQDREYTQELKIFQESMAKAFTSLKATRDQRFKVNENSTRNFLGLLAKLGIESEQKRVSEEMIMSYLATELEKVRLGQLHKYEDGQWDRPLLTDETILLDDEPEEDVIEAPIPLIDIVDDQEEVEDEDGPS